MITQHLIELPAKLFLGKGIDKKFPFLVGLYKKVYSLVAKNGEMKVEIPLGLKLIVSVRDCGLGMFLRIQGQYEPIQTKVFLESLKPGSIVFDIGANVGYYTVLASKVVGKKGKVYAFEPDPGNLKLLQKNIKLNACRNVKVFGSAVGKKNTTEVLRVDEANPGESHLGGKSHDKNIMVQTVTLDSFTKKRNIKHADTIKMDVEGSEIDILLGGKDFLKRNKKARIFTECHMNTLKRIGKKPGELVSLLERMGFRIEYILNEFEKTQTLFTSTALEKALEAVTSVDLVSEKNI